MTHRSSALVLLGALASCLVLTLCVTLVGGGYYFFNNRINPLAAFSAPASLNRIAFVGNDHNIYLADPVSGTTTALTTDGGSEHAYSYPTWAPDSHRLAFVGYTFENSSPKEGALFTIAPTGENLTPIYKTQQNFPFYLYWSPDSQVVSFLANNASQNIALNIARSDQPDSNQEVDSGAPFYWAWSPDSSQMFTHVGGTRSDNAEARLALLASAAPNTKLSLDAAPGEFQAPQWAQNGMILYSTQDGSAQTIALSDAAGTTTKNLVTYPGRASFALSPDGKQMAYILTEARMRLPHLGPVSVIDANGENERVIFKAPALAFFWSPDSTKLAYLTFTLGDDQFNFDFHAAPSIASLEPEKFFRRTELDQGGDTPIQLHWRVWDRATETSRTIASFEPTGSFIDMIPFFDQYANSSTFWSPDSQSLVYTSNETDSRGSVFIADAVGNNPPRKIGDGVIAYWSWR